MPNFKKLSVLWTEVVSLADFEIFAQQMLKVEISTLKKAMLTKRVQLASQELTHLRHL